MKHVSPNEDGSYDVYDEVQDGYFMVMFSKFIDRVTYKSLKKRTCPICDKIFETQNKAIDHIIAKHKKQVKEEQKRMRNGKK